MSAERSPRAYKNFPGEDPDAAGESSTVRANLVRMRCIEILQEKKCDEAGARLLKASSQEFNDMKNDSSQLGLTLKDYSMALYDVMRQNDLPNFFQHVELDQDGGLDSLPHIWTPAKYFWGALVPVSVVFNVFTLLSLDWQICSSFMWNYIHLCHNGKESFWEGLVVLFSHIGSAILMVQETQNSNSTSLSAIPEKGHGEQYDIFQHVQDPDMRLSILTLASVVATLEVLGLFYLIVTALWKLLTYYRGTAMTEYQAYYALRVFFSRDLPFIATFSSIKLCADIHPGLIMIDFDRVVRESNVKRYGAGAMTCLTFSFVISRICGGILAVIAFAVKALAVGFKLINPSFTITMRWAGVVALLMNCMGCVLLDQVLEDRIFLFMFGGEDAIYQDDERAHRNVYQSRLAREMLRQFWTKEKAPLKTLCALATLDHYDLQALLLNASGRKANNFEKVEV